MKKEYTLPLRLNKNNATIFERMEEIYIFWGKKNKEINRAIRKVLLKMYRGECNKFTRVKDRRVILHNLVCIEIDVNGITNSAKLWSEELIEFLKNEPEYIEINVEEYTKALDGYLYTHEDELTVDDKIKIYKEYYKAFEQYYFPDDLNDAEIRKYLDKMNAKFCLSLLSKDYNTVFEIFKEVLLHNNENSNCEKRIEFFLDDVKKDGNIELFNRISLLLEKDNKLNKIS
jgi:hypothetical protein